MERQKTAVIVEDDFLIAEYISALCERIGVKVLGEAAGAEEALALIRRSRPDYLLMDVRLKGGGDGIDVAAEIAAERPDVRVIYLTGSNEPPTIARIRAQGAHRVLIKPIVPEALAEALA